MRGTAPRHRSDRASCSADAPCTKDLARLPGPRARFHSRGIRSHTRPRACCTSRLCRPVRKPSRPVVWNIDTCARSCMGHNRKHSRHRSLSCRCAVTCPSVRIETVRALRDSRGDSRRRTNDSREERKRTGRTLGRVLATSRSRTCSRRRRRRVAGRARAPVRSHAAADHADVQAAPVPADPGVRLGLLGHVRRCARGARHLARAATALLAAVARLRFQHARCVARDVCSRHVRVRRLTAGGAELEGDVRDLLPRHHREEPALRRAHLYRRRSARCASRTSTTPSVTRRATACSSRSRRDWRAACERPT
jgi:hypothetical protein